ncbi:MAG TPA: hypothetical protein VN628_10225 [Vicinamibacterales bacterium]|nr:hypothetical protein [Vicinamibacterales bacterium]
MTRFALAAAAMLLALAHALAGQPGMHDPSTVIEANGKFYVYSTGNGLPAFASDDGWTWQRTGSVMQAVPGGNLRCARNAAEGLHFEVSLRAAS